MTTNFCRQTVADIKAVEGILPDHYKIGEGRKSGSIRCVSEVGIRKGVDAEDEEHWGYVFEAIKKHFGNRFKEVFHNVCFCHTDFIIYYKK